MKYLLYRVLLLLDQKALPIHSAWCSTSIVSYAACQGGLTVNNGSKQTSGGIMAFKKSNKNSLHNLARAYCVNFSCIFCIFMAYSTSYSHSDHILDTMHGCTVNGNRITKVLINVHNCLFFCPILTKTKPSQWILGNTFPPPIQNFMISVQWLFYAPWRTDMMQQLLFTIWWTCLKGNTNLDITWRCE